MKTVLSATECYIVKPCWAQKNDKTWIKVIDGGKSAVFQTDALSLYVYLNLNTTKTASAQDSWIGLGQLWSHILADQRLQSKHLNNR